MNNPVRFVGVTALALLATIPYKSAMANESSYLHDAGFINFCVPGFSDCFNLDHTWAESNQSCPNDAIESFASGGSGFSSCFCTSTSNTNCGCRQGYKWQVSSSDAISCSSFASDIQYPYQHASPGTYGYNGVCHQASNRALNDTSVPWVNYITGPSGQTIAGSGASYGVWLYCGTSNPWGSALSCP